MDELSLPDIWRVFALYTIRIFSRVFGKKFLSFRFIVTLILVSFCLTYCAIAVGVLLDEASNNSCLIHIDLIWIGLLFANLVFDALTGLVTIKVLSVIQRSTPGKAFVLIIIDIIIAYFLAVVCFVCGNIISRSLEFEILYAFPMIFINILKEYIPFAPYGNFITHYLYAGTTFIPTLIYLTILVILIISKAILGVGIRVTKYLLERATEVDTSKDLAVFTLTGSLFSVIVLLLTAFIKLCQI